MWILGLKGLKNKLKEFNKRSTIFPQVVIYFYQYSQPFFLDCV